MTPVPSNLEDRILRAFRAAGAYERDYLLGEMGIRGGEKSRTFILDFLATASRPPAGQRSSALRSLARLADSRDIPVFASGLSERTLELQEAALGGLFLHDQRGLALDEVTAWLERRLRRRQSRREWSWSELPLAIGYLSKVEGGLAIASRLLNKYDAELGAVERQVLETMWPQETRQPDEDGRWPKPDLSGMDHCGHDYLYYLRIDADLRGDPPPDMRSGREDVGTPEAMRESEEELVSVLSALEKKQSRARRASSP